jgi:hypothetical protein
MLTNMYNYGGDSCVNEFYHSWFGNGTAWDNVFTSLYGPPPGYVPGGPNKDFSIPAMSPPGGQPPQKSYKEWNTGWNGVANENSWEITEAGIYTQAAYICLLARVIANNFSIVLPLHIISISANRVTDGVIIHWQANQSGDSKQFELQRSFDGINFSTIQIVNAEESKKDYTTNDYSDPAKNSTLYYRIKETDVQEESYYSSVVRLSAKTNNAISIFPNPAKDKVVISGYIKADADMAIHIFDAAGKLVYKEEWHQSPGDYSKMILVENFHKGIYWLRVVNDDWSTVNTFMKLSY